MLSNSKSTILTAIRNHDYVKAVSLVDLTGNALDVFVIRSALAAFEASNVRLLLEAYLMEQFTSVLHSFKHDEINQVHKSGSIDLIIEVIIYGNAFLSTDIACERLLERATTVFKRPISSPPRISQRQRQPSVKFASTVIGGSSSSSESSQFEDRFWTIFCPVLDSYCCIRPFLQRLVEHMLVNLRGYVQDYSQYQQYADRLTTILRAVRSSITAQPMDPCDCPKNIIPIFLYACVSDYRFQKTERSDSTSSSSATSASSHLSEIYNTEQVQEFWSAFKKDPLGMFALFVDRLRFIADSLSNGDGRRSRDHIPCFCSCHLEQWRGHLSRHASSQDILDVLVSKMSNFLDTSPSGGGPRLGLTIADIASAMRPPRPMEVRDEPPIHSTSHLSAFEDLDQSTSVWSADTTRLPLQPDTNDLLHFISRRFLDDDSSSSEFLEPIDQNELDKRKSRFNEEVLALQRRFLRSSSSTSSYAASNTDSDVESLPLERHAPLPMFNPRIHLDQPEPRTIQRPMVTMDQATSPHPASPKVTQSETACQTSLHYGHAAMQTDTVLQKDATVLAEPPVSQSEAQTDSTAQSTFGSFLTGKQDTFLHVQDMTKRDVQRMFRSAQAFANIC